MPRKKAEYADDSRGNDNAPERAAYAHGGKRREDNEAGDEHGAHNTHADDDRERCEQGKQHVVTRNARACCRAKLSSNVMAKIRL